MRNNFAKRIGFHGKLKQVSSVVCRDFELGGFVSNKLVAVGYEDFNFILKTSNGTFFVKVFAEFRTLTDCKRYVGIIKAALSNGVQTPRLLRSTEGYLRVSNVRGKRLRFIVMDFVEGKTLLELNGVINQNQIRFLARQMALINTIQSKPKFVYDSFAITNFLKEFQKATRFLTAGDSKLVAPLVNEFKKLKIEKLPHCLVHGDLIKTNIIKDKNGALWIVDFACSNYSPRIQELAVLACNILFDSKSKAKTMQNLEIALNEYQKTISLTPPERQALPSYIRLAHAMHIIGATNAKRLGKDSKENRYWLEQGRNGLLQ